MSIKLYYMDVSNLCDKALFDKYYQMMPIWRREKCDKYKFDKDKRLSLGVGILLRKALEERGLPFDSNVSVNEKGKPYFSYDDSNNLTESQRVCFNLSHSGTKAICVVSDTNVGCDIEMVGRDILNIAKRFYSEEENKYIESLPEEERADYCYRLWSLKESFIKAVGDGLAIDLKSFSILPSETGPLKVTQNLNNARYYFFEVSLDDAYKCCVCVETGHDEDYLELVEIEI